MQVARLYRHKSLKLSRSGSGTDISMCFWLSAAEGYPCQVCNRAPLIRVHDQAEVSSLACCSSSSHLKSICSGFLPRAAVLQLHSFWLLAEWGSLHLLSGLLFTSLARKQSKIFMARFSKNATPFRIRAGGLLKILKPKLGLDPYTMTTALVPGNSGQRSMSTLTQTKIKNSKVCVKLIMLESYTKSALCWTAQHTAGPSSL